MAQGFSLGIRAYEHRVAVTVASVPVDMVAVVVWEKVGISL
ncbi:hypothetical protein [Chitinophaga varians]|nr:hypothetical protein [Chitinophaga varians]